MIRIADTFTDALARLTRDEQKAVKTTVFDLQVNPAHPGLSFHKLDRARDKHFWSVRVSSDIRIIVHKSADSLLVCYVDHHDAAYAWAERRKLEVHPRTGAAQMVIVRETVVEIPVHTSVQHHTSALPDRLPVLAGQSPETLLAFGVPTDWIPDLLAADEDTVLEIAERLPQEAAEAVLVLATGGTPVPPAVQAASADPFEHPDAQRRFRLLENAEELERALAAPWEKWVTFLHPAQREIVEARFAGPARVAGTAGTGKTVVALHRAVHLARSRADAKVLVCTFSVTLARMLRRKLRLLTGDDQSLAGRIVVDTVDDVALSLHERWLGRTKVATEGMVHSLLREVAAAEEGHSFSDRFIRHEWSEVVDAWQLQTWDEYRDVKRLGRRTRLGDRQREQFWRIAVEVRRRLHAGALLTKSEVLSAVTRTVDPGRPPYDFVVVDEAQDVGVPQLRFLAAVAGDRPDGLFFAGDLGQRIFQVPFSWRSLGVDVRGRSFTLRINYRTSHQIRQQADRLLGLEIADVDGLVESRRDVISAFNGPKPEVRSFPTVPEEIAGVGQWIAARTAEGFSPNEIGVFVRSTGTVERALSAIAAAGLKADAPAPGVDPEPDRVVLLPMHLAKGLEFKAVAVMACDDGEIPSQQRIEGAVDDAELDEIFESERHLLYVACTRARDRLLISAVEPASEFIGDVSGALG